MRLKMEKQISDRFKKIETRLKKVEKLLNKEDLLEKGNLLKCEKCGHSWITRSKRELVSCPGCGSKIKNIQNFREEDEDEYEVPDAFEGERYKDYDSKSDKDRIFKDEKVTRCSICGKKVNYDSAYYEYSRLMCKKCYKRVVEDDSRAVHEMTKRL